MDQTHPSVMSGTTTYHSFNDVELYEPASPARRKQSPSSRHSSKSSSSSSQSSRQKMSKGQSVTSRRSSQDDRPPTAPYMKRQDSGYESHASTPRGSISHPNVARPAPPRRTSTSNMHNRTSSSVVKARGRPTTRRSMKASNPHPGQQSQPQTQQSASLYLVQSLPTQRPSSIPAPNSMETSSYVPFPPPPDPTDVQRAETFGQHWQDSTAHLGMMPENVSSAPQHPQPPQTTHYWTSDRTRRLEYAAIDAASRGVKGWIKRNLLPDCFVPQDDGHIAFDDDTGSVRRYRLELEDDTPPPCAKFSCGTEKRTLSSLSVVPRRMRTWQLRASGKDSDEKQTM